MSLLVSIFTDASYCHRTRAAGWAAWIKCNGQTTRIARPFKASIEGPTDAEIGAAANALCFSIASLKLGVADRIVLQTDCIVVIHALDFNKNYPSQKRAFVRVCRDAIQDTFKRYGRPGIDIRHVRAHQGKIDPSSAVNDWVDKASREQMRYVRDILGHRHHRREDA